jgi:hypothetical protein
MSRRTPGAAAPSKAWWQGPRLDADREAVRRCGLDLQLQYAETGRPLKWTGRVVLLLPRQVSVQLEIEYPAWYPQMLPVVRDVGRRYTRHLADRHINSDHSFCLSPMAVGEEIPIHEADGFERFLHVVLGFLIRQEKFEVTGRWRGPAVAHGLDGLVEFHHRQCFPWKQNWEATAKLIDQIRTKSSAKLGPEIRVKHRLGRNAPCSCGSGLKYKRCHLPVIEVVVRRCNETYFSWQKAPEVLTTPRV